MRKQKIDLKLNPTSRGVDKILKYAISQEAEEIVIDLDKKNPAIFYKVFEGFGHEQRGCDRGYLRGHSGAI